MIKFRFILTFLVTFLIGYVAAEAVKGQTPLAGLPPPDYKKYEFLAATKDTAFFVNTKDVKVEKTKVYFTGYMTDAITADGEVIGIPEAPSFLVTQFKADCITHIYSFLSAYGMDRAEYVSKTYPANDNQAKEKTVIWLAIEKVCKAKGGVSA